MKSANIGNRSNSGFALVALILPGIIAFAALTKKETLLCVSSPAFASV
ncbi:MAG: hypothetical protein Q8O48_04290 [Anaerolineales bacterium]|nr:hypothetical protein [Anaerolineales bacterium]